MAFYHRILDEKPKDDEKYADCYSCSSDCPDQCNGDYFSQPPPPIPPPLPPLSPTSASQKHHIPTVWIPIICVFGAAIMFLSCLAICRHRSRLRNLRRHLQVEENLDIIDENQGPVVDHPIWYIRTIGLQQSEIDSITVFKYKRDEGLIEGTDCSVCLNVFQENESLRLLPKCSHAFHVMCIDTWLRSHKHCPLCRAPIVVGTNVADRLNTGDAGLSNIVSVEEEQNERRSEQFEIDTDITSEMRVEMESTSTIPVEEQNLLGALQENCASLGDRSCKFRVLSDLDDRRPKANTAVQQMVRRSVSADFSSTSMICNVAKAYANEEEQNHNANASNSHLNRLMKSRSYACSIQKVSVSFKRSFSFGWKHKRSQELFPMLSTDY